MASSQQSQPLRRLRGIVAAMASGTLVFAIVCVVLVAGVHLMIRPDLAPLLLPIVALLALAEIPAYVVVRRVIMAGCRRSWEQAGSPAPTADQFVQRYATVTLAGGAMAEAAGLFGTIVYLLTGAWPALIVPLLSLLVLALLLPTQGRFNAFVAGVTGRTPGDSEPR